MHDLLKRGTLVLLASATFAYGIDAKAKSAEDRWGKRSFISTASSTLDGVKPLASWIWDRGGENPLNDYLLVRKTFPLEEVPKDAWTYISAFAYADVYINGKLLERSPINCDPEYQCYDRFDIAPFLRQGENCISAVVQNFGVGLHSQMNARGGFFFQSRLAFADGSSRDLLSDNGWKVIHAKAWNAESPLREPNAHLIGFVEDFDARLFPEGWQNPEFDDSAWEDATVIGIPPVAPWNSLVVVERPHLARKVVKPVRQWMAGNVMVYDFGVEIVGYPQFTVDALEEGISFEIGTAERLDGQRVPVIQASGDHSNRYTTKKGVQSWRPFGWSGFRYFSIGTSPDVEIQDVSAEFACFDYKTSGSFECSDPRLNEFWKIGVHTMRINSIDTYRDPWREHTQYIGGDSRYMMLYGDYAFGGSARFLSAYNLICGAESQRWRDDGAIRARYPTDYFMQPGSSTYVADYQLEWVLMMHEYFLHFGKDQRIEALYPNLQKAMEYFRPFVDPQTGLLSKLPGWIVLDWPNTFGMERKDIVTGLNCLYYGALNAAAAIARDVAEDPEQAAIWKEQARLLRGSINRELWSEKDRAYLDSYDGTEIGQQPQVYALNYGLPDDDRKRDLAELIMRRGKGSEQSFAYWTLKSMFDAGHAQWAIDYMRENWGAQTRLASFNGTWHEGWELDWGATSHGWSSGPTALLPQFVLGLEPTGYGWKTFDVRPHPGDLTWAKGTIPTVAGEVSAAWEKSEDGRFLLEVTVPAGTAARVHLPSSDLDRVEINEKPLAEFSGVEARTEPEGGSVVTVDPGTYRFACESDEQ